MTPRKDSIPCSRSRGRPRPHRRSKRLTLFSSISKRSSAHSPILFSAVHRLPVLRSWKPSAMKSKCRSWSATAPGGCTTAKANPAATGCFPRFWQPDRARLQRNARHYYDLERLWRVARRIEFSESGDGISLDSAAEAEG